jgi:ABC-type Mn2+/Zn2+ transport system permease subunit
VATIPRPGRSKDDQSARELGTAAVKLVLAYARQETVDPLKTLVRYVIWGVLGAVFLGVGAVLVSLAVVRVLQTELHRHLSGDLTWVPYAGALLFAAVVALLAVSRISKVSR